MASFAEETGEGAEETAGSSPCDVVLIDYASPVSLTYCPHCSMPSEYCQYGPQFKDKCLPHMQSSMTEEALARALGQASLEGGIVDVGPKKSRVTAKEAAVLETKIVIARIQRQKKKFDTSVLGLETVPGLKLEDAAKFFKKKFSCGASVGKTASGAPEVTIQGDVSLELPDRLMAEYKVAPTTIFFLEGKGELRSFA
jgi:density-regulated protein